MKANRKIFKKYRPKLISVNSILDFYGRTNKHSSITCLQIGANDGVEGDLLNQHLIKYSWKAYLLEPQRRVFEEKLKKNYKNNPNIHPINAAIGEKTEMRKIYRLSFSEKRWATGLSSFLKESIDNCIKNGYVSEMAKKHNDPIPNNEKDFITYEEVQSYSFRDLFEKYNINNINILAIDTEGYDYELIKMFDFDKNNPDIVIFEISGLSKEDLISSKKYLKNLGFHIYSQTRDTIAISQTLYESIGFFRRLAWRVKAHISKI